MSYSPAFYLTSYDNVTRQNHMKINIAVPSACLDSSVH